MSPLSLSEIIMKELAIGLLVTSAMGATLGIMLAMAI